MAIDLTREPGLRPCQAARTVPPIRHRVGPDGQMHPVPTHPATIVRWITAGRVIGTGEVVRLEAVRTPGGWITTASAIREFFTRITPGYGDGAVPASGTSRDRAEAADRQLAALGV